MGTMNCTDFVTLSNVLHAPFPINLLSISAIILQLKCVVSFDIPKVIFQEKGICQRLGIGTWHSGLWYLDREGLDSALVCMVEGTYAREGSSHRSCHAFGIIQSVWGPCSTSSKNGYRFFVFFIDCFSHVTWLLMKRDRE